MVGVNYYEVLNGENGKGGTLKLPDGNTISLRLFLFFPKRPELKLPGAKRFLGPKKDSVIVVFKSKNNSFKMNSLTGEKLIVTKGASVNGVVVEAIASEIHCKQRCEEEL